MSIIGIIETVRALRSGVNALQKSYPNRNHQDKTHDNIVVALRNIYFTQNGVIQIMENIANGGMPNSDEIRGTLPEFNDAEWRVQRELDFFESANLQNSRNITLKDSRILREIALGKRNLRLYIQNTLNEALTLGTNINRADVDRAVKAVKMLNATIEELEENYNRRAPR